MAVNIEKLRERWERADNNGHANGRTTGQISPNLDTDGAIIQRVHARRMPGYLALHRFVEELRASEAWNKK